MDKNKTNYLINVKSKYILNEIFENIKENKCLNIIRYNKLIQNRLNKSIVDFKSYLQIEIEIFPKENEYGLFINYKKENKSCYHIYFNDNNKETKRNNINKKEKIGKIRIIIDNKIKSLDNLFKDCKCIKKINFNKFTRKDINNISHLFHGCKNLEVINFYNFTTNNVTDMSYMFYNCESLKELNLNNFKTENVINMSYMFQNCSSLKELDLSNFNTINVIDMNSMFKGCTSLLSLNLLSFNTKNVIKMKSMFESCNSIKFLDLSSFVMRKFNDTSSFFRNCKCLAIVECKSKIIEKEFAILKIIYQNTDYQTISSFNAI